MTVRDLSRIVISAFTISKAAYCYRATESPVMRMSRPSDDETFVEQSSDEPDNENYITSDPKTWTMSPA